jgi:hypothetical protein
MQGNSAVRDCKDEGVSEKNPSIPEIQNNVELSGVDKAVPGLKIPETRPG